MAEKEFPISRRKDIVVQDLLGEVLVYDLKTDKAFCLNETSALVWKLCDGTKSVGSIAESISGKINLPVTEDLVWLALDQLKKENLLSNKAETIFKFNGVSRREAIRKIGLGSMIALPLVSSLVVQGAVGAQSTCIPSGGSCGGRIPCCPGNGCVFISSVGTCVTSVIILR